MSLPPGPRLPRTLLTYLWITRPTGLLDSCARRYGDVFTARLLFGDVVVVSDPGLIKDVFTGDPGNLHAGQGNAGPLEPIVGKNSVLTLDGAEHMRQRKLMLPSFHGERMQRYGDLMAEIAHDDIDRWPVGEPFALRAHTQAITFEVIMRTVFGIEDADRLAHLRDRLARLLEFGGNRFAITAIALAPLRRSVGRRLWERFERLRAEVDEALYDEIAHRREDPRTSERDDVMSILLGARDEDGRPMTDAEVRDELMTLLVAGHETTATALAWTFHLLLHNQPAMDRLRAEVAGGGNGPYLDAVVKETLRMRPVIPMVVRVLQRPLEFAGFEIPAGARLAPSIWLTHHRPDLYPEPETFRPERFLEGAPDTYSWIPFGGGIRRCLGASFATYEMKVVTSAILQRVRFAPAPGPPEAIVRRAVTFVPERDSMVVVAERRPRAAETTTHEPALA